MSPDLVRRARRLAAQRIRTRVLLRESTVAARRPAPRLQPARPR